MFRRLKLKIRKLQEKKEIILQQKTFVRSEEKGTVTLSRSNVMIHLK